MNISARHTFVFNPKENGGQRLSLVTTFDKWGVPSQTIELHSYGNCAQMILGGAILNGENLRKLADEIDQFLEDNADEEWLKEIKEK